MTNQAYKFYIGIDASKQKLDVAPGTANNIVC